MLPHQAGSADPKQLVSVTDDQMNYFFVHLEPTDDGHNFMTSTNSPFTPPEAVAHTLLLAANDVLTEIGYTNALQDALDFVHNLVVDAFNELTLPSEPDPKDEIPF